MSNRDDFSQETKSIVAARASWQCSYPGCPTGVLVGPSDESSTAVSRFGIVAHICAAAPGPGARRYDPAMTPEQRRDPDNGIYLCASHATMIDRDEVSFTIAGLQEMKRAHVEKCGRDHRAGISHNLGSGLLAIGPDVVVIGGLAEVSARQWTLHIKHFVIGDFHKLVSYIDGFAAQRLDRRYVLSNELGDGRMLAGAPSLAKDAVGYRLACPVLPGAPRIAAQKLGGSLATDENFDTFAKNGKIAMVSGVNYLPQKVRELLSMQQNESAFSPDFGMRFFEYFEAYKGSHWLPQLMQIDVIRQASIPITDKALRQQYTPLQCVTRVYAVEPLSEARDANNRLPVRLDFEVQGIGRWQHETKVYIPTVAQMQERAQMIAEMAPLLREFGG